MKHTESLEAAVRHVLHCAMAASSAVERGDSIDRVGAYLADVRKWAELSIEDAVEPETRLIAGRIAPERREHPSTPRGAA